MPEHIFPLAEFFDDAAIFPPGLAPLDVAITNHLHRRRTRIAELTGTLLLPVDTIATAHRIAVATAEQLYLDLDSTPLRIGLIVPAGGLDTALEIAATDYPGIRFTGLELKTSPDNWEQELAALQAADTRLARHAEFSATQITDGALAALQGGPVDLKVRTGGLQPELFPTPGTLAGILHEAVTRAVPFKLTAGLHRGLRHTNLTTGFTHHGFLNIATATYAAACGADTAELTHRLELTDPEQLLTLLEQAPTTTWRRWFTSFGTCSIDEPLESLAELGLDITDFSRFGLDTR